MNTTTAAITYCKRMAFHIESQRRAERKLDRLAAHYALRGDERNLRRAVARLQAIRRHLYN
jgi:hypothetical protein